MEYLSGINTLIYKVYINNVHIIHIGIYPLEIKFFAVSDWTKNSYKYEYIGSCLPTGCLELIYQTDRVYYHIDKSKLIPVYWEYSKWKEKPYKSSIVELYISGFDNAFRIGRLNGISK